MATVRAQNRKTVNQSEAEHFSSEYAHFVVFRFLNEKYHQPSRETTHFVPAIVDGARVHSQKLYSFGMNFPCYIYVQGRLLFSMVPPRAGKVRELNRLN